MSGSIRTSTVIDALLDVNTRLAGLTFTANADTGRMPGTSFLGFWTDESDEFVQLVGKVSDDDLDHAGVGPAAREETYVLHIRCGTTTDGSTGPEALARLKAITDVVEVAFRDQTSGQPIPPDLGGAEVLRGGINRVEIDGWTTDKGAAATADIYLRVYARI